MRPRDLLQPLFGREPRTVDLALTGAAAGVGGMAGAWVSGSPLLGLLLADVAGGVLANHTAATAAWYAEKPRWLTVVFVALHLAHTALAAALGGGSPAWALLTFGTMAAGVLVVQSVPRAAASGVALLVVVAGSALLPPLPAFPPFTALYLLKLVHGFGVGQTGLTARPSA